jgi:GH24 family phage-related lysozyme (muramidase)
MAMDYLQRSADLLSSAAFEGSVAYMYRDTVGLVTVGVGQLIPDVNAAKTYPFLTTTGANASTLEIETDYKRVKALSSGHPHKYYWTNTALVLSGESIQALLIKRVKEFDKALRATYLNYDTYPEPVKLALLDMIYNIGPTQLFGEFKHFGEAVNAQDWRTAAARCHRIGPSAKRNAWTAHQFRMAAGGKAIPKLPVHPAHHDAPGMLSKPSLGPLL